MEWHPSHKVETPREGEEHCVKCGIRLGKDRLDDYSEYAPEPCNPSHWHKYTNRDGTVELVPYFIPPGEIFPMPSPAELRKLRSFWRPGWCTCIDSYFGIGYDLARHRGAGDFCIACDSEFITSKHHCHCPVCGGINQVG